MAPALPGPRWTRRTRCEEEGVEGRRGSSRGRAHHPPTLSTQLAHLHAELRATATPAPDVDGALEILLTGAHRRLPTCLAHLAPPPPPPPAAVAAAAARMGRLVRAGLLAGGLPPGARLARARAGVATLESARGEYAVRVTLAPPAADGGGWRWRVVEACVLPGYSPPGAPPRLAPPPPPPGGTLPAGALASDAAARLRAGLEEAAGRAGEGGGGAGAAGAARHPLHAVHAALLAVAARVVAGEAAAWARGAGAAGRWAARVRSVPATLLGAGVRLEFWPGVPVAIGPSVAAKAGARAPGGARVPPPAPAVELGAGPDGAPAALAVPHPFSRGADSAAGAPLALAPAAPDPELLLLRAAAAVAAAHLDAIRSYLVIEPAFNALGGVAVLEGAEDAVAALGAAPGLPPTPPRLRVWVGGAAAGPPLATLTMLLHSGELSLDAPAGDLAAAARRAADADAAAADPGAAAAAGVARALAAAASRLAATAARAAAAHAGAALGLPAAALPRALAAAALAAAGADAGDDGDSVHAALTFALAPPPPVPAGLVRAGCRGGARAPRGFLLAAPPATAGGAWSHVLVMASCDVHGVPGELLSAAAVGSESSAAPPAARKRPRDGDDAGGAGGAAAAAVAAARRDAAGWGPGHAAALARAAAAAATAAPWLAARHQLAALGVSMVDERTPSVPGGDPRLLVAGLDSLAALEAGAAAAGAPAPRVELRPAPGGAAWRLLIRSAYFAGLPVTAGAGALAAPAPADARRVASADGAATASTLLPPAGLTLDYRPADGDSPAVAVGDALRCLRLHTFLARGRRLCAGGTGGGGAAAAAPLPALRWRVPGVGVVSLAAAGPARAELDVVADGGGGRALARARVDWVADDAGSTPRARFSATPPLPAGLGDALGEAADAGAEAACLDGLAFGAALAAAAEAAAATAGRRVTLTTSLASLPGTYDIVVGAPGRPPLRARVALAAGGSTWAAPRPGDDRAAAALGGGAQGGAWARGWDKLAEMLGGLARAAGEA